MGKSNSGNNVVQHKNCIDCGIPMVSGRIKNKDVPQGHKRHKAHGRCEACDTRHRTAIRKEQQVRIQEKSVDEEALVNHYRADLEAFLKRIKGKSLV